MVIKVVTDSTSELPGELAESLDITVVPLNIHFGTEVFKDGIDLDYDEFYRRLVEGRELPTTSQPSVGDFVKVYEELGRDADGIVSIHISSKLSGTLNSATQAREQATVSCPVEVIDSNQASMGLGVVAVATGRSAQHGAALDEVADVARSASDRSRYFALLDTLKYLERGGRIGKARALLGTVLRIRPMIEIRDGEVHELAKERTRARAIARLEAVAREYAPLEELSVVYSTTPEDAHGVASRLRDLLPGDKAPIVTRVGPVVGTYSGPGCLAVGLLRSK